MNTENAASSLPEPHKVSETIVYIFNMSEDVWPFIQAMSDARARAYEIEDNMLLADSRLFTFAGQDNVIFISPQINSPVFIEYITELFGNKNLRLLVSKNHTGEICRDIAKNEHIIDELVNAANGSKKLTVTSYATSPQFLELVKTLREKGLTIATPDVPEEENAWTVNFFGSKSGIRQLAQKSGAIEPDFKMADGVICMGIVDAARIAAKMYMKEGAVVVKTNKGHSGMGVLLFRPGDLPTTYQACEETILSRFKQDNYWNVFPIILENFIHVNPTIGGGFPSIEFRVTRSGRVEFLYYCGMRVTKEGTFKGVEIHNEVVSDQVAARLMDTGFFIGEQYAANGYRGYFDVDFVAAKNGELYVTESNIRQTGGTFVYKVGLQLFGKDFLSDTYTLSNNLYTLPEETHLTFSRALDILSPVCFNKKTKEGVILVSENFLKINKLPYITFGKTKKRAYEIEAAMEELLRKPS